MTEPARREGLTSALRAGRKVGVAVVGAIVLAAGVAMIVLPGPAIVVIPLGLAVLATEFAWARRLLGRLRESAGRLLHRSRAKVSGTRS